MPKSKGKLYSRQVWAGDRSYYFDIQNDEKGVKYLSITESKYFSDDQMQYHRIKIYKPAIAEFNEAFKHALGSLIGKGKIKKQGYIKQIRTKHPNAAKLWTEDEDFNLEKDYNKGKSIPELAELHQRTQGAIKHRLKKLGYL